MDIDFNLDNNWQAAQREAFSHAREKVLLDMLGEDMKISTEQLSGTARVAAFTLFQEGHIELCTETPSTIQLSQTGQRYALDVATDNNPRQNPVQI